MKRQSLTNYAAVLSATVVVAALNVAQAYAVGSVTQGVDAAHGDQQPSNLFGNAGVFSTISNVLLFIVAILAYAAVNFVVASFVPNAATNGQSVTGTSAR